MQVDLDSVGCVERPSVEKYWVERRGMITVSARPQDLHGLVEIVRADGEVHTSGVPKLLIWVVELGRGEALEYPARTAQVGPVQQSTIGELLPRGPHVNVWAHSGLRPTRFMRLAPGMGHRGIMLGWQRTVVLPLPIFVRVKAHVSTPMSTSQALTRPPLQRMVGST